LLTQVTPNPTVQDTSQPGFWDSRYAQGQPPWSERQIGASLVSFLKSTEPGAVLIPGCGTGYTVRAFHDAGWQVTAVDFSPVAVEQSRRDLGELGRCVLLADFFHHEFGSAHFDICYEQSFLCSLPPRLWPAYAQRVSELLHSGGALVGSFYYGHEPEPPPYPLDDTRAWELFGERFSLRKSLPVPDANPFYVGGERWLEWTVGRVS
jgi:SAM-dependent methyltransferase